MMGGTGPRRAVLLLLLLLLVGVAAPAASGVVTDGEISIANWHSNGLFSHLRSSFRKTAVCCSRFSLPSTYRKLIELASCSSC